MAKRVNREEYEQLCRMIQRWNENRLELFEITMPNENLEFEGIMRFYFQSPGSDGQKVATKCIRVSNTATTVMVIEALVEKFRPDLRMLTSHSSYALYEVHSDEGAQEERRLEKNDHPLLVQLGWANGDREGRFLLRQEPELKGHFWVGKKTAKEQPKKDKRYSKRKKLKKGLPDFEPVEKSPGSIARSLYHVMPESRLTRSISVKSKRNQFMRGERKHASIAGDEFDDDGTVRVYADSVLPDVPCKSLLISSKDTATQVVRSALDKYGLREDPGEFCLVQITLPPTSYVGSDPQLHVNMEPTERILGDKECPLQIHSDWTVTVPTGGTIQFQLRRRSSFSRSHSRSHSPEDDPTLPTLVEIFQGAQSPPQSPRRFFLSPEQTEIGSNVALLDSKSYICLTSAGIKPRHCVISNRNGIFRISPLDKQAVIYMNDKPVRQPAYLPHNAVVRLGEREVFRFFAPVETKLSSTSMHTLPTNIGRQGGATRETRGNATRSENISKAYSVEDILNPMFSQHRVAQAGRPLKDRAYSEYNLKADGALHPEVRRKLSVPSFEPEDQVSPGAKHGNPLPSKRRHYSSPLGGDQDGSETNWILPASLSFYQAKESLMLQSMISEVNGYLLPFKLAPAYGLYMVVKHHLSPDFQPSVSGLERRKCLLLTLKSIISQIKRAVKDSRNIAGALAFWLANTSEFLHYLKRDYQLGQLTADYEVPLAQIIHTAYKQFTQCMLKELGMFLPTFYDESNEADSEEGYISGGDGNGHGMGKEPDVVPAGHRGGGLSRQTSITGMYWSVAGSKIRRRGRPTIGDVLTTLSSTVSLLKRCRVNATLSVMIFSLLFRYISTKLFNKIISDTKYCSRAMGQKLKRRLDRIKSWAEKEGMELPAENHLVMVVQTANLLQAVKKPPEDAKAIFAMCSKLNSRQISTLLHHCSISEGEAAISQAWAEELVMLAQTHTDETQQHDGMEIALEEDPNLELPFLIPQLGYSCDSIRGLPPGLQDYLEPMISAGFCKLTLNKDSTGFWAPPTQITTSNQSLNSQMSPPPYTGSNPNVNSNTMPRMVGHHRTSEQELRGSSTLPRHLENAPDVKIIRVTITKENNSLGISIVGGKNSVAHGDLGIFVKSMVEGGTAHQDGRLKPGDQILKVDNCNLEGCTQEQAAQILRSTGKTVTLIVAKQAAAYYGLSNLIHQGSPRYSRKESQIPEGSSYAHKVKRRQKREQQREREKERERQRQERYPHHEFRLERRKPELPPAEPNHISSSHSHVSDSRLPPHTNPQFAKWIMEQNVHYNPDKGSEIETLGSMSSLTNIPERDRAGSPVPSYTTSSTRPRRDSGEKGCYRSSTPPVRDTGPSTRPTDYQSSYASFGGLVNGPDAPSISDVPTKFSEYSAIPERQVPSSSSHLPYRDATFSLNSQPTLSSQQMLTPFSQQQNPSQQQSLDKLSMDVNVQTQLSGTSAQGITAVVPKLWSGKVNQPHPLNQSDLKGFEMDEIGLLKQRMQLMYYEQQKQKEQEGQEQNSKPLAPESQPGFQKDYPTKAPDSNPQHDYNMDTDDVFPESDRILPAIQLRQELESLEQLVNDQKRRCREIKLAREREELSLKQVEKKFHGQEFVNGSFGLNPTDPHRWQREQKKKLRELERIKAEQSKRLQQFEYEEHRSRSKLKALEAQASEIRQQLQQAESASPRGNFNASESRGSERYPQSDLLPSKLTSDQSRGREGMYPERERMIPQQDVQRSRDAQLLKPAEFDHLATPADLDWTDPSKPIPARVMSMDSVSTATWMGSEQHDLRELGNTMSEYSVPTQDDPIPTKWSSYNMGTDLYSTHSRVTLNEDQFPQDERLRRLKEEHVQSLASMDSINVKSTDERDLHITQLQQEARGRHLPEYRQQRLPSPTQTPATGFASSEGFHLQTSEAWNQPHRAPGWAEQYVNVHPHTRVPAYQSNSTARADHYYSRSSRPARGYPRNLQPSGLPYRADNYSVHGIIEQPVQDGSRIPASATPDVIPPSYNIPLSRSTNPQKQTSAERSISPASRHSSHTVPRSPPYSHVTSHREQSHSSRSPSVTSPNSRQEPEVPIRSPTDRSNQIPVVMDQPKFVSPHHFSVQTPLSPSRPPNPTAITLATAGTRVFQNRVHDPRTTAYERVSTDKLQNAPEKDMHHFKPVTHRYGISRPDAKVGTGHSYSRGRPEPMPQMSSDIKLYMEQSFRNPPVRHPERIQRQQTEL